MVRIEYKPGTESGPYYPTELEKFRRMLRVDMHELEFDSDYVSHMVASNGGEPAKNAFRLPNGELHTIDRVLNFADIASASESDALFHVHQTWNLIEDRLNPGMFPFAALPGGDFLIFDHSSDDDAVIKLWFHELSTEDNPHTEPVASSFAEFTRMLQSRPVD